VFNLSDKVNIWELLKGNMSLANIEQCYGENKALAAFNTELCVS
jgi:hypothetical protein